MKRKLRIGERYALSKHKRKQTTIRYLSLLAVLTSMCLYAVKQASAQQAEPAATAVADIKPLQIGDTIPDWLWQLPLQVVNHPEGKDTITLDEYRGKLMILDFWATWCSPCIKAMPVVRTMEQKHAEEMVVIPVSSSQATDTEHALRHHKTLKPLRLSSVVEDTLLRELFPFRVIPHYTWINRDGIYLGGTDANEIIPENLQVAISGVSPGLTPKTDLSPDRPLFLVENLSQSSVCSYSILKKGEYPGYGTIKKRRLAADGRWIGLAMTNTKLLSIFETIFDYIVAPEAQTYSNKKLILDGQIYQDFAFTEYPEGERRFTGINRKGLTDELFSYDIIIPSTSDDLPERILEHLNDVTGYEASVETKEMKCLALTSTESNQILRSKGGKRKNALFFGHPPVLLNAPIEHLVVRLNGLNYIPHYILNETGITYNIDIQFGEDLSFQGIQATLLDHGLQLVETEREMKVFVLKRK